MLSTFKVSGNKYCRQVSGSINFKLFTIFPTTYVRISPQTVRLCFLLSIFKVSGNKYCRQKVSASIILKLFTIFPTTYVRIRPQIVSKVVFFCFRYLKCLTINTADRRCLAVLISNCFKIFPTNYEMITYY